MTTKKAIALIQAKRPAHNWLALVQNGTVAEMQEQGRVTTVNGHQCLQTPDGRWWLSDGSFSPRPVGGHRGWCE